MNKCKDAVRELDWKKLKLILDKYDTTQDAFNDFLTVLWHSDSMVRCHPEDDGIKRDQLLESIGTYYQERGIAGAKEEIAKIRSELLKIDSGYIEIYSIIPKMQSAKLTSQERIAGAFAASDYAIRQVIQNSNEKFSKEGSYLRGNRNLMDSEGKPYDPNANIHRLTLAVGDVIMSEAYQNKWFDPMKRVILPDFEKASDNATNWVSANLYNASRWRLWKNLDERVRFLNANLEEFSDQLPAWVSHITSKDPDISIKKVFEFKPKTDEECYEIFANERLDTFLMQAFQSLLKTTDLQKKFTYTNGSVPLAPKGHISIFEFHAAASFSHLTKIDISKKMKLGKLLLTERLRGYAVLQILAEQLQSEQETYYPRISNLHLLEEFQRHGLTSTAASTFIELATFRSDSRDLYDQPLVKTSGDDYIVFSVSLLMADLVKIMFSSLANEGAVIEDKGKHFETETINYLCQQGLHARQLKVRRGLNKEHEFDYDVAFTWDDYVFFLECKNRGIPFGNPIATHYFNQELRSHVKQISRLQQGFIDYPDILQKDFPEALGKKPIFCLMNALPFSIGKLEDIYVIDDLVLRRFFDGPPSMGFTAGRLDGKGPQTRTDIKKLWSGSKPTASEFINYINSLPQLAIAKGNYEEKVTVEQLSLSAFIKVADYKRKDNDSEAIAEILKSI